MELSNLIQLEINENLRNISIPKKGVVFGVDGDIEVNRVAFVFPRYYSNFDMTEFSARVNYVNANGEANYYEADDMSSDDGDTATFSWLMTSDVTSYIGEVRFSVLLYKQLDERYVKKFGTRPATGRVLEGLDVESYVTPEQQLTLIEKMEKKFDAYVEAKMLSVNHDIEDAKNGALDAIEEAKNDVDSFIASSKSEIDSLLSSSLDDIKNLTDTSKLNISTLTDEKLASLDKETIRQLKNIELAGVEETEKIRTAFSSAVSDIQTEGQKQADAIDSHGDSKIKEINDSTATSLANINSISEKQVEAIQLEGTKQTSSVSSEGNKQVSTVASAGATEVTKVKKASSTALSDIGSAKESSISEITAKGTEQVKTIKDTSASEISKVQEAGISQVKSVSDEGKIQIDGVKSEGEKQVQSVSAKGTQSLQDIDTAKTAAVKSVNDQTKPIIDKVEQLKQNVNDKSDSVDETYEQMKKLHCIEISEETPTNERAGLWVNPESNEEINIPEIKDEEVSDIDTWSSQKINHEIDSLKEETSKKINYKKIDNELRKSFYSIVNEFLICDGTLKDEYSKSGFENNNIVSTLSGYGSNTGGFAYTGNFTYDVGDEIYVSAKLTANGGTINKLSFFGVGLSAIDTDGIYYVEKIISPKTLNNNDIHVTVSFENAKNKKIILSDIIIVNLTKTFGKGNEPSIEEFKNIISVSNGLIDDGIINLFNAKKTNEYLLKIDNFEKKDVLVENLALRNGTEKNQGVIKNTSSNVYFEKYSLPETASQGDVVYSCSTFRYDNDTCTKILVKYDSNTGETASPIPKNEWFTLSSLGFVQDGKNRINCGYYFYFDDGITNKTVEFKDFIILNLTTIFGKGNEPSKETIDKLLSVYENRCFDGVFGSIFNGNLAFVTFRNIQGVNGNHVKTNDDGSIVLSSVPNYNWSGWAEIGNYGQENKGNIPIYNKVHGTLETDGMLSVLPIWGCWSENSAAKGTGSKYHGGHVFHGWTTDRKHRLTMLQNIYRDDEAAIFNYIPGDKANNGEGTFLRLRLGADNIGKGILIVPVLDSNNHYAYTRHVVFGRLNIQSDRSKYDVNGNGESAYTKGLPVNTIPSSSTSDGIKGDFTFDSNYAYFCVDDNKWKRIPLEEW